jgi:hypothetical protein
MGGGGLDGGVLMGGGDSVLDGDDGRSDNTRWAHQRGPLVAVLAPTYGEGGSIGPKQSRPETGRIWADVGARLTVSQVWLDLG